jgi:hypothetical protein
MKVFPRSVWLALALGSVVSLAASSFGVLNGLGQIELVDPLTNADSSFGNPLFPSDSLAITPAGQYYSADAAGMIFNLTATGPIPAGPSGYAQIGDLDFAPGGLWGFSNAVQDLFFFNLGSASVTYSVTLNTLVGYKVTGVAYQPGSGDIFLSANLGLNTDQLYRVDLLPTPSVSLVGALLHSDGASYVSDIDFGAGGTLYAMTWFHRHFYSVNPATAATAQLSVGPHRDATAMAFAEVPEATVSVPVLAALFAWLGWRRVQAGRR